MAQENAGAHSAPLSPVVTSAQTSSTATPQAASPDPQAPFGEITGVVKSGTTPLPGVTVSAANTLTGKKFITSTELDGSFKIAVTGRGRYVVRAEFSAFAPVTQEIVLSEQVRNGRADLSMILLSRAEKEARQEQRQQIAQQAASSTGRTGMQQLALAAGGEGENAGMVANTDPASLASAGLPNAGLAAESNESVAVSGAMGRTEQNPFDPGEMQDRLSDLRDQMQQQGGNGPIMMNGGGPGGMGGGGFAGGGPMVFVMGGGGFGGPGGGGGGRGGRGMRGFDVNKPHGSLFYTYDGSALDAKPFSLNGQPEDKASYNQNRFGATIGGPLNIPHIYNGGTKTFIFGNYTGTRSSNPYDVFSTVPTLAERNGDFSSLLSGPQPLQLINPVTNAPFLNNQVPVSSVAAQLLAFIPQANLPGTVRNFHFVSAAPSNTDTMFLRINHNFGADQPGVFGARGMRRQQQQQGQNQTKSAHWSHSINGGFVFNDIRNSILNPYPGLGGHLTTHNYNINAGYSAVKGFFLNSLRFVYNRSSNNTLNNFTNANNIEGTLGISGVSQLPADYGLPVLNFAPQFSSLQDLTPAFRNNQTYTISDSMSLTHGKHAWTWGGDFRRLFYNVSNAANARGTFVFTGAATNGFNSCSLSQSCAPFADFLLGFAQQTSVTFGAEDYQFRANSWDLFVQDTWRAGKNLTFSLGVRYERVTPYIETDNQLVNLDIAPTFTAVAPVLPGQVGAITGMQYPTGLINTSHYDFAPRVGIAWKPFSKTVVRAGYGINYNLAQYGLMATQLGFQPPFAVSQINPAPTTTSLTLQNGFPASPASPDHITNTYAVSPNYQLPYVQTWNLNIQQEIKSNIVVNIGYAGAKGTHLDVVGAPDQNPVTGLPIFNSCTPLTAPGAACVSPYLYEFSGGSSIMNAGTVRVRKRMRHGLSLGGTYTFSKSIDDASSIGGGGTVVAQNFYDIAAERGLSSFNQTHRFTADYYYELPLGKEKKWLNNDSWAQKLFGGFAWSGNITMASGFPFSPRIFGSSVDLGRGVTGSARPDLVPGQSLQISNPGINQWFNVNAFTAPAGPFGDAGRNIITGPGTISVNMAFSKTIQVKEMQSLELRLSANNVFNHANFTSIDTTLGSPTFGEVVAAGAMRTAQLTARYRF
jgi:TonB dependent receptor-like, beta-barrel/Carboxypeptidase regulatory-like domain